jgi:hypothetical protein
MNIPNPFQHDPIENRPVSVMYTEEQLMARLKFFIGICLALTLTGIVFVVLYSIIFVTQPLNAISPIDQKFFELIVPIATFLTGTLSGIMLTTPQQPKNPQQQSDPSKYDIEEHHDESPQEQHCEHNAEGQARS